MTRRVQRLRPDRRCLRDGQAAGGTAQRVVLVACNHGGDAGGAAVAEVAASLDAR